MIDRHILRAHISKGSLKELQDELDEAMNIFLNILPHAKVFPDQSFLADMQKHLLIVF